MISSVITDIGTTKEVNQDAIFCKHILVNEQRASFGCVCDGLGGLTGGEIASSNAVRTLSAWFQNEYPLYYDHPYNVQSSIKKCINHFNAKLFDYSRLHHSRMGTTISGVIINNGRYMTVNVGDSRTYLLRNGTLTQLTKDHSYIQQEIDAGRMTEEEAKNSDQQNVLTYCVGAYNQTVVDTTIGDCFENDVFFFCSDGARHEVSSEEMIHRFSGITSKEQLQERLVQLVELCKQRGETDNISIGAIIV